MWFAGFHVKIRLDECSSWKRHRAGKKFSPAKACLLERDIQRNPWSMGVTNASEYVYYSCSCAHTQTHWWGWKTLQKHVDDEHGIFFIPILSLIESWLCRHHHQARGGWHAFICKHSHMWIMGQLLSTKVHPPPTTTKKSQHIHVLHTFE